KGQLVGAYFASKNVPRTSGKALMLLNLYGSASLASQSGPGLELIVHVGAGCITRVAQLSDGFPLTNLGSGTDKHGSGLEMSDHAEFAVSVIDDQVGAGIPSIRKAVRVVVRVADARNGLIRTLPDCADHY